MLIKFPVEGVNSKIQNHGIPTRISWAEWNSPWKNANNYTWMDMKYSEKFPEIQGILGIDPQRGGDCRQLDTAYKNKSDIFLTSGKGILKYKNRLEPLLDFAILDPDSTTDFQSLQNLLCNLHPRIAAIGVSDAST